VVDHEGGRAIEEIPQQRFRFGRESCLGQGIAHQLHPPIPRGLSYRKRRVAHTQTRVTPLLDVTGWSAETVYQEFPQTAFRRREIACGIHGSQQSILWNLAIERRDQTAESVLSDKRENFPIVHWSRDQYRIPREIVGKIEI